MIPCFLDMYHDETMFVWFFFRQVQWWFQVFRHVQWWYHFLGHLPWWFHVFSNMYHNDTVFMVKPFFSEMYHACWKCTMYQFSIKCTMYNDDTVFFGCILVISCPEPGITIVLSGTFYKWGEFTVEWEVSLQIMLQGKMVHFLFPRFISIPFHACYYPLHTPLWLLATGQLNAGCLCQNASLSLNPVCTPLIRKRCWGLYDSHRIQTIAHESQPLKTTGRVRDCQRTIAWFRLHNWKYGCFWFVLEL